MDIHLSPEHERFRLQVREFAEREVAPVIRGLDAEERFGAGIVQAMGEAGFLGASVPRAYGGLGLDYHSLGILCEELERLDTFPRVVVSVHLSLNSLALYQWGTPEQKERYLRPQASGAKLAGFALTEPEAGTDAGSLRTRAARVQGGYRLSGDKRWIGLAGVADHFIVFATLDPALGTRGITAFIVERSFDGMSTSSLTGKLGIRGGSVGSIQLRDVFVPFENRLGEEGEGFKIAMSALDNGRYSVAAGSMGIITACLEQSLERARSRRTFGREIGRHQLVQQMIARMIAARDVGRLLVLQVGWLKNQGRPHTREVSLAKWLNCDAALQTASDAIQIFGADGYTSEHPVERHFRNARAAVMYEGTREIHQVLQAEMELGVRAYSPLRCTLPPYPFAEDAGEPADVRTAQGSGG